MIGDVCKHMVQPGFQVNAIKLKRNETRTLVHCLPSAFVVEQGQSYSRLLAKKPQTRNFHRDD